MDFADLLSEIDRIPGDYKIRFMTSHPKDAGEKLFRTMAQCAHVAKQLHLPVQSGSSRVLKAMNRGYTREQYLEKVRMAREAMPDVVLTSDIIIGFPGETEAEAMETVSLIEEVRYDALFTFIYSPRPGTPAAKMPDPVSRGEKQVWFDKLLDSQNRISGGKDPAGFGGRRERRPGVAPFQPDGGRAAGPSPGGRLLDRAVHRCPDHRQQHLGAVRGDAIEKQMFHVKHFL